MTKKLKLLIVLLLLSSLVGWTQSLPKQTTGVVATTKNNSDTTITGTITKSTAIKVVSYFEGLEKESSIKRIIEQQLFIANSIIVQKDIKIGNLQNIIIKKDSIIYYTDAKFNKADKGGKTQEQEKLKYKKQVKKIPGLIGVGGAIGFILCHLLTK